MNIPEISVIIAAHNEERFVGRCVRSLLKQSIPRDQFEIVVVNDGSDDRTQYALDLFGDEVRVLDNTQRLGLPSALNLGIRSSHGQFIVRVDADDYVHTHFVGILAQFLRMNSY